MASGAMAHDVLIVSDLHLRGGYHNPTEGLYHFDEEFADFLRYYRLHRGERPWQLLIGGDFVEFLYITDPPDPAVPMLRGATFTAERATVRRRHRGAEGALEARHHSPQLTPAAAARAGALHRRGQRGDRVARQPRRRDVLAARCRSTSGGSSPSITPPT